MGVKGVSSRLRSEFRFNGEEAPESPTRMEVTPTDSDRGSTQLV